MADVKKSRHFILNLYPQEDETHKNALDNIIKKYECAYVTHDKDCDEDTGELKKSHVHVVVRFPNARSRNSFAEELNIKSNYIEKAGSFDSSLLYLIHFNNPEKYQYSPDEVKGNLKGKFLKLLSRSNIDEDEAISRIFEYIDNSPKLTVTKLAKWCCKNGFWTYFRRSGALMKEFVSDHNNEYSINFKNNSSKNIEVQNNE